MTRFELYKKLKEKGFPQGGSGSWLKDPQTEEKVYIPHAGEIYTQFIADPDDWSIMLDAMVNIWINRNGKK